MLAGIRVARLDRVRECANSCPIGPAQLLRAGALLLEDLAQIGRVALELTLALGGLLLGPLQACTQSRNSLLSGTGIQFVTIGARQRSN